MFKKSHSSEPIKSDKNIETLLEASVEVKGNLKSDGNVKVDGKLQGDVKVANHLIIGDPAEIKGNVSVGSALISGTIEGNVQSVGLLELTETAKVVGDIETDKLKIAEGAVFIGNCKISEPEKEKSQTTPIKPTGTKKSSVVKKDKATEEIKTKTEDKI